MRCLPLSGDLGAPPGSAVHSCPICRCYHFWMDFLKVRRGLARGLARQGLQAHAPASGQGLAPGARQCSPLRRPCAAVRARRGRPRQPQGVQSLRGGLHGVLAPPQICECRSRRGRGQCRSPRPHCGPHRHACSRATSPGRQQEAPPPSSLPCVQQLLHRSAHLAAWLQYERQLAIQKEEKRQLKEAAEGPKQHH